MKTIKTYSLLILAAIALASCEGKEVDGYGNAGLTEKEEVRTRALIDSSLIKLKNDLSKADSVADNDLKKEIEALKEEIKMLKSKK